MPGPLLQPLLGQISSKPRASLAAGGQDQRGCVDQMNDIAHSGAGREQNRRRRRPRFIEAWQKQADDFWPLEGEPIDERVQRAAQPFRDPASRLRAQPGCFAIPAPRQARPRRAEIPARSRQSTDPGICPARRTKRRKRSDRAKWRRASTTKAGSAKTLASSALALRSRRFLKRVDVLQSDDFNSSAGHQTPTWSGRTAVTA